MVCCLFVVVVSYLMFVSCYSLFAVCCVLLVGWLFDACCLVLFVFGVCWLLVVVCCL